jgi:KaiC/GvpD/RAD55 family RecA-like ATPase
MLDPILKHLLRGVTLIEDEYGAVNKIISRQLGAYAKTNGKNVLFLETPSSQETTGDEGSAGLEGFEMVPEEALENTGAAQKNAVVYRAETKTEQRYLPFEELNFDLIVFDSFSSYIFTMSDKEVADLMEEIVRLSKQGKSFVLTSEYPMLSDRISAYVRAKADSLIIVRAEIAQNKVNRMLYVPKMIGTKPMDRVVKITVEEEGVDIDTREFVG